VARTPLGRVVGKVPAKPAEGEAATTVVKRSELSRAVRRTERQIDRTGEVKSLPQRQGERSSEP
jgi:hypothetical protein